MNRNSWIIVCGAILLLTAPTLAYEPLPRSTAEEHQVDQSELTAAFDAMSQLDHVGGMVVVRDGHVIGEDYWSGPAHTLRDSRSVTKSVVSTLVGIAIEEGFIEGKWYARMVDYLPDDLIPDDPAKHEILILHLLTMTAGWEWDDDVDIIPWLNSSDPLGDILSRPLVDQPGTQFTYNTAASHLLSVVLTEATGMGVLEFADTYLFGPLGITERSWVETGGYPNGGLGLRVRTEDLAKFGILFMNGGSWNEERIVSNFWTNIATWPLVTGFGDFGPLTEIGYGLLWWIDQGTEYHAYTGWGYGGQFVFTVPALKLVVAVHSSWGVDPNTANQQEIAILDIIVNQILPATTDRRTFQTTGQQVDELADVDQMMQDIMQEHQIRDATAAIAKDGRLVYARGFSWGEPEVEPVQPTALFRTGSIGKAITSVAVHQLIGDGQLSHQTPVTSILDLQALPDSETDPLLDEVTVDHLLTHTSGMYSEDNIYDVGDIVSRAVGEPPPPTTDEILSYIVSHPFIFNPETNWDYNNYGYMMLGEMVESTTGTAFSEYVQSHVFRPAGVGRARVAHMLESELVPTEVDYDGLEGDPYSAFLEAGFPAGGWVMSAPDMARIFSALFDSDTASGLLPPAIRDQMFEMPFQPSVDEGYARGWYDETFFFIQEHTLGWLTDLGDGLDVRCHGGGGGGVHTLALWRSDGITFVILTNKDPLAPNFDFPAITSWPDHDLWESVGISPGSLGEAPTEAWIPVVANADGVGSSVWRSDVGLLNRSTMTNHVRLRLYLPDRYIDQEIQLAPWEYRTMTDVVAQFNRTGSHPLRVFSSEPLTVTSRTYNQTSDGTFGQFLDSQIPRRGLEAGDEAVLMQLRENDAFRTNIGIHNGWKRAAEVEIALLDGDSLPVASFIETIPAESTVQINRPFWRKGGRADISSGYAVVSVLVGQHVTAYGSVVDNYTDDPTTIPMKFDPGFTNQWLAAAANSSGAQDSSWRTDLTLLNRSGAVATAEVRYRADDGAVENTAIVINTGEQQTLDDVIGDMGMSGGGSLQVFSDHPILVSSRTYNTSDDGTFGQFLDGYSATSTASSGDVVWLPQLQQNPSFRTNIGVLNSGNESATVRIRLFDQAGQELAARLRTLPPMTRIQFQEPFSRIAGRDDIDEGYATVTVEAGNGVVAYASVIDNATNDPTTVPMMF